MTGAEKKCSRCNATKPLSEYTRDRGRPDGRRSACAECERDRYRERFKANPESLRASWRAASARYVDRGLVRWKKYGLSAEQYAELVAGQNGRCLICGDAPEELVVDHCHKSGYVRALLCGTCNTGLGMFRDSPDLLQAAARYLAADHPQTYKAGANTRRRSRRNNASDDDFLCADCHGRRSANAVRCRGCHRLHQYKGRRTKTDWPPLAELLRMVDSTSFSETGRHLGVTDNAVRKHIETERRHAGLTAATGSSGGGI